MFGKKQSAEPAKVTSTSLAEESAKIIELQTEAANLEAVSNKATAMTEKIGGLLS